MAFALLIIVLAIGAGSYIYVTMWAPNRPITSPTQQCTNGATNWPLCNNQGTTSPGTPYYGSVIITATSLWAYDGTVQTYTNGIMKALHADGTLAGALTQASSTFTNTVTMTQADNGVMKAVYLTGLSGETAFFVDPALTQALSGGVIASYNFNTDFDSNGQNDLTFILNIRNPAPNGNNAPTFNFNIYGWKQTTSNLAFAAITGTVATSSGFHTAGDYVISGYLKTTDGNGYAAKLVTIRLWASDTAASNSSTTLTLPTAHSGWLGPYFGNNNMSLTGFSLGASGANAIGALKPSTTVYGVAYGIATIQGVTTQGMPTYDPSNTRWVFYSATGNSIETALPIVYERGAGINGIPFNLYIHSYGGVPSGYQFNMYLEAVYTDGAGTTASKGLKISFAG